MSGRDMPADGLGDAVGCFSGILVCRLLVPPDQTVAQLLLDADDGSRAALDHQHVDISQIQHTLNVKGRTLFNTCISFGYEDLSRPYLLESDLSYVTSQRSS